MNQNELPEAWRHTSHEADAKVGEKDFSTLPDLSVLGPPEVIRARAYEVDIAILLPDGVEPHPGIIKSITSRLTDRGAVFTLREADASAPGVRKMLLEGSFIIPNKSPETQEIVKQFAFGLNILMDGQVQDFGINDPPFEDKYPRPIS